MLEEKLMNEMETEFKKNIIQFHFQKNKKKVTS